MNETLLIILYNSGVNQVSVSVVELIFFFSPRHPLTCQKIEFCIRKYASVHVE